MRGSLTLLPDGVHLPGLDRNRDVRFSEPWQAQAFALTVLLNQRGVFTWDEWAAKFSRHLGREDSALDGSDYYHHWVKALGEILDEKDLASIAEIAELAEAWQRAAHATPHGQPILLENADR